MATIQRTSHTKATFYRSIGGVVQQDSVRTDFISSYFLKTVDANGKLVTLPGGNKFRKSTDYSHWSKKLTPGDPQNTSYIDTAYFHKGKLGIIRSSAGGYAADGILRGWLPAFESDIGSFPNFGSTGPVIPEGMRNEAVTKALLKLADNKAGIGEDLATFRQIVGLVENPCRSLEKLLRRIGTNMSVKQFLRESAQSLHKKGPINAAAKQYLAWVYGAKPLMQDIYGAIEMLKAQGNKSLLVSGRGISRQQCNPSNPGYTDVSAKSRTDITSASETAKVSCHIWGRIDPNATGLRALNQLGLLNPASLAWELVSWSFVVDWFVPIGPVLQALTAPAGLIFVDACTSVKTTLVAQYEHHYKYFDSMAVTNSFATGTVTGTGYKRVTYSTWPMPGFYYNRNPFSGDRPLKALALAIVGLQKFRI